MKKILEEELKNILDDHKLWLDSDKQKGKCANLSNTDLSRVNLSYVDLSNVDLSYANLAHANLYHTNLIYADLSNTVLIKTKLREVVTQNTIGKKIIAAQINTSRKNNLISYWVDLGIWTTGCFQGTLKELKKAVEETHKDNEILRDRYYRTIIYILNEAKVDEDNL